MIHLRTGPRLLFLAISFSTTQLHRLARLPLALLEMKVALRSLQVIKSESVQLTMTLASLQDRTSKWDMLNPKLASDAQMDNKRLTLILYHSGRNPFVSKQPFGESNLQTNS